MPSGFSLNMPVHVSSSLRALRRAPLPSARAAAPARPLCTSAAARSAAGRESAAAEPAALPPRAGQGSKKRVGAHVSIQGGIDAAVVRSAQIGARAMAFFTRNQRRWVSPALKEADAAAFRAACERHGYDPARDVVVHGIYLLNCASPDSELFLKSSAGLLDDVRRCGQLGVGHWNFHPGSAAGSAGPAEATARVARAVGAALAETEGVSVLLENTAGEGSKLGATFDELAAIIDAVEGDRSRVGVCLDTCHLFASGYDISTREGYERTFEEFEKTVGLDRLRALHLNDSKGPLGCRRDRHENIGRGHIGLEAFRWLMADPRFDGLPLVLETPDAYPAVYADEVRLLYALEAADDAAFGSLREKFRELAPAPA
eukprot:tig00020603_g11753.t1